MITLAFVANNLNKIIFFRFKNKNKLIKFNTNQLYLKHKKFKNKISNNKLTKIRLQEKKEFINKAYYNIYCNLIDCLPWLIISMIFFIIHFLIFKYRI